jgi:hypothetical protein
MVAQALTTIAKKSGVSIINNCTLEGIHLSQDERMESIDVSLSTGIYIYIYIYTYIYVCIYMPLLGGMGFLWL